MFNWEKKGLLFKPNERFKWMHSHAQVPFTVEFDDFIRVYFSTREKVDDQQQFKSYSGYVDLAKDNLHHQIAVSTDPIIALGGRGEFDEFGSMAGSIVKTENDFYLYYCGWTRCKSVPYNWAIGLASSRDGKHFKKLTKGPLIGPQLNEPYLQACPIVYRIEGQWYMYYLSGIKWIETDGKLESQYLLMLARSDDGINWQRNGQPIITPKVPDECQTSASIIALNDKYHMFFSYRHGVDFRDNATHSYKIGYAWSTDLIHWTRDDKEAGLNPSKDGWDSQMVGYPHIFRHNNDIVMLYCGNNFGREGFGYAVLQSTD